MKIKNYIEALEEYIPGFQPDLNDPEVIKLNANENAYPPSPKIEEVIKNMDINKLRIYPKAMSDDLRKAIASVYKTDFNQVFCGNGSDEIISLIMKVFLEEGGTVVAPYPTYTVYKACANIEGVDCEFVDVNDDFTIDVDKLLKAKSEAIFLANPNAPTGILLSIEKIKYILDNYDGLVVVDEAYMDFCDEDATMIKYINDYSNLVVMRTMSKSYSLCGARLGYCFADKRLIRYLDKCRDSYNINYMTQIVASAAVLDEEYHLKIIDKIKENRKYLFEKLEEMNFKCIPSQTNFILCTPSGNKSAKEIMEGLKKYKIYIRYFESRNLSDKLRITVGTKEEIDKLIKAMKEVIAE
ncbi:histidinol-phosphate aminotransferase [Clostridium sp. DSM 8431]|uniref:histidinol-phosphate transaminase n=1 Tax=Clostridium sp. DSM 8431 TaxID=1761781 RepID=UPI0008E3BC5B|nr:histidinol-phosphate transaminase [Clostridium sp. DSM 8431]SFU68451.1 histidinol-phosphate aminotransferase [Clostridium sp. DSM 8431]